MDEQQKACVDATLQGKNVFLTGSAGTGKSFTIQTLEQVLREQQKIVSITAMTGCAAILLSPKARTLHSWAGIGLGKEPVEALVVRVRKNKQALQRWKSTHVLVVDEVSMLGPTLFEKLEEVARRVRKSQAFFGGLTVVLAGDFFQLPPVDEPTFLFQSPVFRHGFKRVIHLQTIYRQKEDKEWYQVLQHIRTGQLTDTDVALLQSRLVHKASSMETPATVLYPINRKVDTLNDTALLRLDKPVREFNIRIVRGSLVKVADVEPIRQRMGIPSTVRLAEGAHVILTWNMDLERGLVNGSQGIVRGFSSRNYPVVDFRGVGQVEVEPMEYVEDGDADKDHKIAFHQFPLKLSWALSIHKVQGHNLDTALMDLGSEIFECGQAYVALSRIKTLGGVWLSSLDTKRIVADPAVIEFYEAL